MGNNINPDPGDSTQFDAEAYASVYDQYPENVRCIWIRISEGYSIIQEAIKNPDSRFIKVRFFVNPRHLKKYLRKDGLLLGWRLSFPPSIRSLRVYAAYRYDIANIITVNVQGVT